MRTVNAQATLRIHEVSSEFTQYRELEEASDNEPEICPKDSWARVFEGTQTARQLDPLCHESAHHEYSYHFR